LKRELKIHIVAIRKRSIQMVQVL